MYGQTGHKLEAFIIIIIIIKTPFYLLKINKIMNKKYLYNAPLLTYLHL